MAVSKTDKKRLSKKARTGKKAAMSKKEEPEPEEESDEEEEVDKEAQAAASKAAEAAAAALASDDDDDDDEDGLGEEEEDEEEDDEEGEKKPKEKKARTKADRIEKALAKEDVDEEEPRGVIYLGHIPKGFTEPQMRTFFNQFGTVTRLRLSRSKKNAAPKGYGFIEFKEVEVASIVAKTMNKYMMFGKQLVSHLVDPSKLHPRLFKGATKKFANLSGVRRQKHRLTINDRPQLMIDGESLPQPTERQDKRRAKKEAKLQKAMKMLEMDFEYNDNDEEEAPPAKSPKKSPAKSPKKSPADAGEPAAAAKKKKKRKSVS